MTEMKYPLIDENMQNKLDSEGSVAFFKTELGKRILEEAAREIELNEEDIALVEEELALEVELTRASEGRSILMDSERVDGGESGKIPLPTQDTHRVDSKPMTSPKNTHEHPNEKDWPHTLEPIKLRHGSHHDKQLLDVVHFIEQVENIPKAKAITEVKARIMELVMGKDLDAEKIAKWLEEKKDEEARALQDDLISKALQADILQDLLAVLQDEKEMYNQWGERVHLFKEAEYMVSADNKLLKDGDTFYLLKKSDVLSDENRDASRQAFERLKLDVMPVRSAISKFSALENTILGQETFRVRQTTRASMGLAALEKSPFQLSNLTPLPDSRHTMLPPVLTPLKERDSLRLTPEAEVEARYRNEPQPTFRK